MDHFDVSALNGDAWIAWMLYWLASALWANRTKFAGGIGQRLTYSLPMIAGFWFIWHGRHPPLLRRLYDNSGIEAIGDIITFSGLLFTVWARVNLGRMWSGIITLKEDHRIIRSGPYQLVRHPIYTGLIAASIGSAVMMSTGDGIVGVVLFTIGCMIKLRLEEKLLTNEFGDEYLRFKREVPALVPYRIFSVLRENLAKDSGGQEIHSDAFAGAALRSEQFRVVGIILILLFLASAAIVRCMVSPAHNDDERLGLYLAFLLIAALFELATLGLARRALRPGRSSSSFIWALNTIVECSFPTLVVLASTFDVAHAGPYRALVSSPVLTYFLFIILSTMRLKPWMCFLSGAVCAAEYLGLFAFTIHLSPHSKNRDLIFDSTIWLYAANLLFAGIISAAVARRIRRHVVAALAEAETRRKLDRVEYDLRMARSIQMGLQPKSAPKLEGYDIAGWSEPADQTGGDFYDWIELPGGKIMFTIADASGHGIGPALLIAACRAYFRAIAQRVDPLEQITAQVDSLITRDTPDGRFITAAIALLDSSEQRISIYSAGHAPLYFLSSSAEIQTFDADQPPLGMGLCGTETSTARILPMLPGDALVLVTDGFFEWSNPAGELVGIKRLGEWIQSNRELPASTLIGKLHKQVLKFAGGTPQADDLTAVVIKRKV